MVTRKNCVALLLTAAVAVSVQAENEVPLTGDTLKRRLQGNYSASVSAGERLKASRADTDSLRVLSREDIQYRLPNGSYVLGMLLPNGKVSPAVRDGNDLAPACVTTDFVMVPGAWDGKAIRCELLQHELAVLTDTAPQIGIEATGSTPENGEDSEEDERKNGVIQPSRKYAERNAIGTQNDLEIPPIRHAVNPSDDAVAYALDETTNPSRPASTGTRYVPPARNSGKAKTVASVLRRDPNKFGVPMGTWVKAELLRPVSSAETGLIEFTLTEDLVGRLRTMPAGTTIFSEKAINESEKRLESLSQIATLPDGTEIKNISLRAFSLDKTAGISGTLIRDREGEFSAIGSDAALSTISALAPAVEGAAGAAVDSVTGGMIDNEKRYAPKTPKAVIRVTPQPVLLKVARTF